MLCVLIRIASSSTLNILFLSRRSKNEKNPLSPFASRPGAKINPQWFELPISRTNLNGPKYVRAILSSLFSQCEAHILVSTTQQTRSSRISLGGILIRLKPGPIAQLAARLTADLGGCHFESQLVRIIFLETDHELISAVVLRLPLIQEWRLSVTGESMSTSTG